MSIKCLRTISEWLHLFERDSRLGAEGREFFIQMLRTARTMDAFDPARPVALVRAPGRHREFGNHTDYRACCGLLCGTASKEAIYGIFQARDDAQVVLRNLNPLFEAKTFPVSETQSGRSFAGKWDEWDQWATAEWRRCENKSQRYGPRAWDKYIRGLLILLGELPRTVAELSAEGFPGFTALYHADLTYRGGKSSSSALVVCTALGLDALFRFDKPSDDAWIDLMGISEWYAMTRGGCADHAQIIHCRRDHFTLVGSFPTTLESHVAIPGGLVRAIVHCGVERPKNDATLDRMRVGGAAYALAILYIKQRFPHLREPLEAKDTFYGMGCLRDLTAATHLDDPIPLTSLYDSILRGLPTAATRAQIFADLPDSREAVEGLYANHQEPAEGYPIRDVAIFGIAETERAIAFMQACEKDDVGEILRLARLSHDGDRVRRFTNSGGEWGAREFTQAVRDNDLDNLVALLRKNPNLHHAQLQNLPGRFARSIPEMDLLADVVEHYLPGAAAIRVMGAGLGGEMHAIVREEKLGNFLDVIQKEGFRGKAAEITIVEGAYAGASVLEA